LLFLANTVLGALVLGTAMLVLAQLLETWRIGGARAEDAVVVLGQRIGYPAANAAAIAVAVLAGMGLLIVTLAARAAARELRADRRFRRAMARRATVRVDGAWVVDDDRAQAFCAGLVHPQVYVSRAALQLLSVDELSAVLAHERHHARHRDPLRLAATRVLADAAFFLAPLLCLIERQHSLAEIAADETAVAVRGGDPAALAAAMLRFSESGDGGGIAPERIDHLVGEGHSFRFPAVVVLAIGLCLAAVGALGVFAAEAASGTATLAPPFVSSQPCVLILASIPGAAITAGALSVRRQARTRSGLPQWR
jgi:Zn-dependent protease with chaperone function